MAGLYTCRNDKGALTNNSSTFDLTYAVFYIQIPVLTKAPVQTHASAPALTLASAPGLLGSYTKKNLQKITKLALKLFVKGQKYG